MEHSKQIVIDGWRYIAIHPQVEVAWEIGVELVKLIGAPAASMAQADGAPDKAARALTDAVTLFLSRIEPSSSLRLMKKILSTVEVLGEEGGDNKKILLNDSGIKLHFQGRMGSMMKLAGEVIAFTHADFFDAIADGIATMMQKASEKAAA